MRQVASEVWADFPALDLVRSSRSIRAVSRVAFAVLVFSLLAMFLLPWRQTAPGTGMVLALNPQERPQAFKSPARGIVKYVRPDLREGSYVEQDMILLELEPTAEGGVQQIDMQIEAVRLKVEAAQGRLEFAKQQIDLQRRSGEFLDQQLQKELEAARTKWEQAKRELAAFEAELVDKQNRRSIAENVFERGIISREELVTRRQEERTQQQRVERAEKMVEEAQAILEAKTKEIESRQNNIEIMNREAQNKMLAEQDRLQSALNELSDLKLKRQELDRLVIRAPRSGHIQQWYGLEGSDTVKEGDQLFVLVPQATELAVEMIVNGNDMPLVQDGYPVRLQFEGWPAVQFVGWPSVAIGTFGGRINRVLPTDDGRGNFRVLVTPEDHLPHDNGWPSAQFLRQGVRTNGWVLLREVPLGYEIWRQLNGFPPSLTSPEDARKDDKGSKVPLPKL